MVDNTNRLPALETQETPAVAPKEKGEKRAKGLAKAIAVLALSTLSVNATSSDSIAGVLEQIDPDTIRSAYSTKIGPRREAMLNRIAEMSEEELRAWAAKNPAVILAQMEAEHSGVDQGGAASEMESWQMASIGTSYQETPATGAYANPFETEENPFGAEENPFGTAEVPLEGDFGAAMAALEAGIVEDDAEIAAGKAEIARISEKIAADEAEIAADRAEIAANKKRIEMLMAELRASLGVK